MSGSEIFGDIAYGVLPAGAARAWWWSWLLSTFAFVALTLFAGAILVLALG